jgi:hypothetical protein
LCLLKPLVSSSFSDNEKNICASTGRLVISSSCFATVLIFLFTLEQSTIPHTQLFISAFKILGGIEFHSDNHPPASHLSCFLGPENLNTLSVIKGLKFNKFSNSFQL